MPKLRLQKQLSRKVGDKKYVKWVITIPPKQIKSLEWEEGEFLESVIINQELILKKESTEKVEIRKQAAIKAWETRKKREDNE